MKQINTILALSAAALIIASCSDSTNEVVPQKGEKALVTFGAETESTATTRANFADLKGTSAAFKWEDNDLVGIMAAGSSTVEQLTAGNCDGNKATLSGTITVGDYYLGVYPKSAIKSKGDADNKVTVTIPAIQNVPVTSEANPQYVDPSAFIQVGYTHTNFFQMMTPCSFLRFNTGTKDNITWVKVTAYGENDAAYAIVGDVTVEKSVSSTISLSNEPGTQNEVTCKYNNGAAFPAGCTFGIAIRPGSYKKIVLTASDGTSKTATQLTDPKDPTFKTELTFERAFYYPMGNL